MKEHLTNKLKQAPTDPGVYQFFNSKNKIIYIGKAKNIKNRVRSYFQNSKNKSSKTITLVKNIENIDWIIVRNEVEALMTEANLIKKHQPRYNIDLRDDKSYPFIRITNESYPQVFMTRKIVRDGSKYYGPFTDSYQLRIILKAISRLFQIRSCSYTINQEVINKKKISVCLDYHIKKCEGPGEEGRAASVIQVPETPSQKDIEDHTARRAPFSGRKNSEGTFLVPLIWRSR